MRTTLLTLIIVIFSLTSGYTQQIENGSFEEWELIPEINLEEPVNWSSIKTSDAGSFINNAAPKVWDKSTDARTGMYSVQLTNKAALGIVATGSITNGRVHAELNPSAGFMYTDTNDTRWNTPVVNRPDSLVGWYKQSPSPNDFSTVKVLIHKDYGKIPEPTQVNWIGIGAMEMAPQPVTEWTRFSVPIEYLNDDVPEYVLVILTAGNGTSAIANSTAWYDDIELVYNNQGFFDPAITRNYQLSITGKTIHLQNIPQHILAESELEVCDITGRIIWRGKATGNEAFISTALTPGIYIISLTYKGESFSRKIYSH